MNQHILLLGGIIMDQYLLVDQFPQRGEDIFIQDFFYRVGGCAINVATTIRNLGGTPHIVSQIGDDQWGNEISEYLDTHGFFKDAIQVDANKKTGYCISLVESSGERTFMTLKGCESEFYPEMVSDELINRITCLFVTGYYLLDSKFSMKIIQFIEKLKRSGVTILFDPGPLVQHMERDILLSMIQLADYITPNKGELEKLKQIFRLDEEKAISWFFQNGIRWLIRKNGSDGVHIWTHKGEKLYVPSYPMKSVDTSGAGDSFAGGLLYGLLQNFDLKKTIQIASACGALTTTFMGPHGAFSMKDILNIMGE